MNTRNRLISAFLTLCMLVSLFPVLQTPAHASTETDAFGIAMPDMTDEELQSARTASPFGKASNSSWFSLFTVNELFVAKGYENDRYWNTYNYEGSIGNALGSNNVGSNRIDNKNGLAFVSTAAVDVNGSGKKDHVAVLAYNRAQERLELFLTDQYGTRIGSAKVFGYAEDGFDYMDAVSSHDYTGLVSLTAGDFDGDGKDTVVVYWPRMRADDDKPGYMPAIFETEFSGSGFSLKRTITKNIYSLLGTERQNEIADSNSADGKVRDNCAVVDLVAADTDKDGLDELLITAGMNDCSANDIKTRQSKLFIMDLTSDGWSTTHTLDTNGYQDGKASNPTRLRWASSSVGNLIPAGSGSDYDEILTAGWVDEKTDDSSSVQDRIGVYLTFCTGTTRKANGDTVGSYQSTGLPCLTEDDVSEFTRGGHWDDDCQSLVPVAVFNGDGVKESGADNAANVLIADTVYLYKDSKLSQVFRYDYFNDDDDGIGGTIITNGLVQSAVAGNFDGNTDGKEQVILTTCQKQSSVNNYFYKVYTYQKNGKGEWTCDASSYVVDKKSTAYLSLCPVDVDDDSTIVKLKDISRTYTDVEALAVLESSPTFAEIEGGDVGNGATAYGKSKSSGTESSYSNSLTVNTVVGFEWEMDDVTLGFSLGAGFEATTDHAFTWETSDTTTLTYELNYANDTGDNLVIVYRRPVTCYRYEVKDSDAVMTVNRVGNLVTSMVTVDEYNALASRYEMDRIPDDLLGEAGNPHTYHNTTSGLTNVVVAPDTGHYAANGTTEMAFTTEQEHSDAFSYEMDVSFTAYGQVFGAKFGGGAGYTHSTGSATISSEGITKSGAVTGHIENGYDFNWQFMHWVTELNHCEVPVLGYLLSNVIAPPTPPVDLVATDVTANSARLTWEIGDRPAEEYRVYQIFPNGSVFRVATVDGTENACTLSDLEPGDTYEYVVRGYAVPVTADATGESVSSESVIFTTTPQDAEPVQITAPANMSAAVGATASTSVDVQVPASTKYKGIELQWQVRQGSGNWTDVPDATNSTLTLSGVTQADDGNEYRCKVTAYYGVTVLTYYSETATLQIGRTPVTPTLTVENALGGTGTEAEPYTGKADYNRKENTQTEQTSVEPVTIDAAGSSPALTVYGVAVTTDGVTAPDTAESAKYYGQAEDGTYYTVTKTGETYAAADAISVEETTSYHTVDGTDYTPPAGFTAAQMTKTEGDNDYALFAAVTGTQLGEKDTRLSTCTDPVYYWFSNGNYYAYGEGGAVGEPVTSELDGLYEVYQLAAGDAPLILGRGETWQEAGEDVSGYWYDSVGTEVTAFAETGRTTSYKVGESALSDFEPGKLIALTKTVNKTVDTIVYTPVSGTELTLEASFGTAKNTPMEFRITNVSTGAVQTVSAVTDGSAGASVNWTAPAVGQYRIEADLRSGGAYFCETPAVCWYDAAGSYSKTATEYSLVLLSGETELNGSAAYGGSITPKLRQRTITVDDTTETVGDWTDVTTIGDKTLVYTCVQGSGEESEAIAVLEKPDAGVYTFYAYAGAKGAASERIGSAVLTVTPSAVTVTPTWDSGVTPVSADDVTLSSSLDGMSDAALKEVLSVNCGYFDKQKAGRYTVTLGYRTDADAGDDVAAFRNNYAATLKSDSFVVKPDSGTVSYSCGENGSIAGRYSDQQYNLVSGSSQMKGTKLIFTAVPESGYSVEQWTVNDAVYAPDDTPLPSGFALTNGGQTLTLESYDAKPLNVFVSFQSDTNTIIYGVSSGVDSGSVSATFGAGLPIASGAQVNDETDVTFTAVPAEDYVVDHWTVDDVKYTRADGSDYTAKTLTLDGVSEAHKVYVSFAASTKTYTVSVQTANESGEVDNALAAIAITDADTGESITTMPVPEKSNLCFTAMPANADNNMVKEWQISTDGVTFTTVKGSGGQSTLMLYNLGADTTVRAIVTTAMRYTLSFVVAGLPDGANATLAAFSGAAPLTSGEQQSGYMQVDFILTLDDNLYVTGWENAAEDDSDSKKATIASLNEDTTVTVTVAKKPVVSITSLTGGTLCVSGTRNGVAETELSSGDYVDVNTALTVTATPNDGYVVDNIQNEAVNEARANGEITKQLDAVNADVTVTGAFLAKPVVTIVEGLYGTVTANGTADEAEKTLVSGDYVDYGTDVSVTLSPDKGYELSDPDAAWTAVPDSDDYTYTIQGVLSDQTIAPTWSAIPTVDVTYAVTDKTPEDDTTGLDGTLTASVTRRNMDAYAVEADSDGSESVYRDSVVTFAAVPESGYKVAKWIVNETEQAAAPELTITADTQSPQSVRVQFEQIGEEVSYGFDPAGVSDMAELSAVFTPKGGTEQPFTSGSKPATSGSITFSVSALADGYEIEGWYVNGARQETDASDAFVLPVTTDVGAEVMVRVIRCSYAVSFAATNGTVTATLGGTALADGSEVTGDSEVIFTAVPAATTGYAFEGWSVNGTKRDEESETLSLTVTEPVTVAASYELDLVRYAVTYGVVDGGEGTLSAKAGSKALGDSPASVNAGSSLRFTATAAEGRQVKGWYSDAEGTATIPETAAEQTVYSIESLTAPLSVYVAFEPVPTYTVTVGTTGMGSITVQVNGVETALAEDTLTVSRHDSVRFTALPDENHYLTAWTLDGEDLGNDSLTLDLADVTADCSVGADFAASQFVTLRTDCGEHGALTTRAGYGEDLQVIDAADGVNVEKGKNVTLSATPDTGYMVKSWTVNGTVQSNLSNSLTMENLSENTTVALQYEPLKLWAVPGSGTGYTVTNVERSEPEYGDDTHVRDRGSVSFTVAPLEGYSLTKLEVTQPTEGVTIEKNEDGSDTVTVEQVTKDIVLDAEALKMQTERKELTEVPDVLQETYDSPESLKTTLRAEVRKMNSRVLSEQITFFDIVLQYTTDGSTWLPVTKDNFPVDGVTVSIPYTDLGEGADKTCTYTVIHMFTVEMNGHTVGETEQLASTKTETELRFTVTSLSPFAIGWSKSGGAGGSTGGSAAAKSETVTLSTVEHGTVAISDAAASEGDTVTLTVTPEADYTLKSLVVTDKTGTEITLNTNDDGIYSFAMPRGTVRVSAVFAPRPCPGDQSCPLSAFADLNSALWYHDGVHWALENGVMNGGDDGFFHPEDATSRAMLVTVLHRMAGKPASDEALAFSDVPENKWYTEAVRWAAENGVVHGYSTGAFAPDDRLSREQLATILFRYAQAQGVEPERGADDALLGFSDAEQVSGWAMDSMRWAVQVGLLNGTDNGLLLPGADCSRSQLATVLLRFAEMIDAQRSEATDA